jgi:polyhydroxyalkanoate synthase
MSRKPASKSPRPQAKKPVKRPAKKPAAAAKSAPEQPASTAEAGDPQLFAQRMAEAADIWQRITQVITAGTLNKPLSFGQTDPFSFAESLLQTTRSMNVNPVEMAESQLGLVRDHMQLWGNITNKLLGKSGDDFVEPSPKDRRFKDEAWKNSTVYDYIKQSYLLNSRWLQKSVHSIKGLDAHTARKLDFFTRQFIDAVSPSNFLFTNPEVMRTTLDSNGENIVKGMKQLLADLEKGQGRLRISMTDESAFHFGKDIAATPGSVVYQNDLMQLIQYEAVTKEVAAIPLLLVPAWINKYYILDLRPESSFIKWLTEQGFTVFVISWVNPDEELGRKRFDDYLTEGPLAALDAIESITGAKQTAMVGYCLGGTLTSITLAYLRAKGQEARVASATYLTTLVDFAEAGDISVFIDDTQLAALEDRMSEQGYLDASDMANTFNMLRANDLIWSFVVNNYLLGKQPFPFDLLYWNADATRMPATMHAFYLRNMYQQNKLVKPNGIEINGVPINLTKIKTPTYIMATKEDHIAPWVSAYLATQVYDGPVTFTLADSGHVAGVINPPAKKKYGYWVNENLPPKAEDWFHAAKELPGSWWTHWAKWQQSLAGGKVKARKVGSTQHKAREAAPGSYAKLRVN